MIKFQCPKCARKLSVGNEAAGKIGKCPGGGKVVQASAMPSSTVLSTPESVAPPEALRVPGSAGSSKPRRFEVLATLIALVLVGLGVAVVCGVAIVSWRSRRPASPPAAVEVPTHLHEPVRESVSLPLAAQEIAEKALESTVVLVMEDANGQLLGLGSGFFVQKGQVVTNFHVVAGAARGYAKLVGEDLEHGIEGAVAIDRERDLVVLKVSGVSGVPLSLGNSDVVQIGAKVYAIGNP